jgi:8-oxo-dGTP diphosphatase
MADPMTLVRDFYRAVNRSDLKAVTSFYDEACIAEYVFTGEERVRVGLEEVRAGWAGEFAQYAGALVGGHRVDVTSVAGIETGWGWVRAEWVAAVRSAQGEERMTAGYSHFLVDHGHIRRHRNIGRPMVAGALRAAVAPSERRYPSKPMVGVGAVVLSDDGRVVLVKRRQEPLAGQWSLPGGMLELGESLEAGVAREVQEETGLVVTVGPVVEVFDRILLDDTGRVRYHFVLVDYLCRIRGGTLAASSDVEAATMVLPGALEEYHVAEKARAVVAAACRLQGW